MASLALSFDEFTDQVEAHLMVRNGWSWVRVQDYISPRTMRLIQAYQEGSSVAETVIVLGRTRPVKEKGR